MENGSTRRPTARASRERQGPRQSRERFRLRPEAAAAAPPPAPPPIQLRRVAPLAALALALAAAGCGGGPSVRHARRSGDIHVIRHVIVIMEENRSFDSFFGTYPGADGIPRKH